MVRFKGLIERFGVHTQLTQLAVTTVANIQGIGTFTGVMSAMSLGYERYINKVVIKTFQPI